MMNSQWRAMQSFHDNQKLVSAINTLSIHTKVEMAGHPHSDWAAEVPKAKEELCAFLTELHPQVQRAEVEKEPLLGVNPRRQQFVRHLLNAKQNSRIHSPVLRDKLSAGAQLLHADAEADKEDMLLFLEELRMLIEEHLGSDVHQLFGGI